MPDGWNTAIQYTQRFYIALRWSLLDVNPLDVDYDPDADGWLDRDILDTPTIQGVWRIGPFLHFSRSAVWKWLFHQYYGIQKWDRAAESTFRLRLRKWPVFVNGVVVDYRQDVTLSDGRRCSSMEQIHWIRIQMET